jgi:hypothetical protein
LKWAWTWSGRCFGYWLDDDLWTYQGKHVGRRRGTHIHAPNGRYLGEVMGDGRLITNKAKAGLKGPIFVPGLARAAEPCLADGEGRKSYLGHEDFPHPDEL